MAEITTQEGGRAGKGVKRRASAKSGCSGTFNNRPILGPKWLDHAFMRKIGIYDDVLWMFRNIGIDQLFHMDLPAYEHLCVEFFSSLNVKCDPAEESDEGEIEFVLGTHTHKFTIPEFNTKFGYPLQGARVPPDGYEEIPFGVEITGCNWFEGAQTHRGRMKAIDIQNPCFRYVQRFLAYSIFGRENQGSELRQEEIFFIWSMVHNSKLDVGFFLAKQLMKVAKMSRGAIVMGGFITHIAQCLGVDFASYSPIPSSTISEQHCINIRMIRPKDNSMYLIYRGTGVTIKLPDPNRTSIRKKENWIIFNTVGNEGASSRSPAVASTPQSPPEGIMHDVIHHVIEKYASEAPISFEGMQIDPPTELPSHVDPSSSTPIHSTHPSNDQGASISRIEQMYASLQEENARLLAKICTLEDRTIQMQNRLNEETDIKGAILELKNAMHDMNNQNAQRQAQTDTRLQRIESWMQELDLSIARVDSP